MIGVVFLFLGCECEFHLVMCYQKNVNYGGKGILHKKTFNNVQVISCILVQFHRLLVDFK